MLTWITRIIILGSGEKSLCEDLKVAWKILRGVLASYPNGNSLSSLFIVIIYQIRTKISLDFWVRTELLIEEIIVLNLLFHMLIGRISVSENS